jgi:hypothetical protein
MSSKTVKRAFVLCSRLFAEHSKRSVCKYALAACTFTLDLGGKHRFRSAATTLKNPLSYAEMCPLFPGHLKEFHVS